jgi:hypothetical protein
MSLTTIAAGLSGLKSAADMTKALRDGLKAGSIKADEIAGRIGEIYDYITDSKAALVDAQEEIHSLKTELHGLRRDALVFLEGDVNWEKRADQKYDGPLCPACWGLSQKRVPLTEDEHRNHPDYVVYYCLHHGGTSVSLRVRKEILMKYADSQDD